MPYIGILLFVSGTVSAQSSFQSVIQTGISLPVNSNGTNETHAGTGIHFGNHLNYVFGRKNFKAGLGVYVGYLNSVSTNDKYKQIGQAIALKYGFPASGLTFKESLFKSTHFLAGPVASYQKDHFSINLWAKGGYAFNEPSQYAVIYKENGVVNNIYVNQAGDDKNGIAYNVGAGLNFSITKMVDLQLSANYFGAKTGQVNYSYDREKGLIPLYFTTKNNFVQASIGLQLNIGKQSNPASRSTRSNFRNTEMAYDNDAGEADHVVKTKGNIKNNRMANANTNTEEVPYRKVRTKSNNSNDRMPDQSPTGTHHSNINNDTLVFNPEKIKIISTARQTQGMSFGEKVAQSLSTVDNFLTAFVSQTKDGAGINQCGASPENSLAGADVSFYKIPVENNALIAAWLSKKGYDYYKASSDMASAKKANDIPNISKTNPDGSFSMNDVQPGGYAVTINADTFVVNVQQSAAEENNGFQILDVPVNECTNSNNVIYANNKMFVEVINTNEGSNNVAARKKNLAGVKYTELNVQSAGEVSGIAGGAIAGIVVARTTHNPLPVTNTDFAADFGTIYTLDNKMYAEVTSSSDAGSSLADNSVLVTGDIDADGINENIIVSPRDAASGLPTGKRMHKPFVITKELGFNNVSGDNAAANKNTVNNPYFSDNGLEGVNPLALKDVNPLHEANGASGTNPLFGKTANPLYQDNGTSGSNPLYENTANPLYEPSGGSGTNPLFQGKGNLPVTGSNGTDHTIFYPGTLMLNIPDQRGSGQLSGSDTYKVMPVKWMSSENSAGFRKGWDGTVKGGSIAERKGWDGSVKGSGNSKRTGRDGAVKDSIADFRKGWDGTVKGGSIAERKGWDGTVKGGSIAERKGWDGSVKGSGKRQANSAANTATGGSAACNIKNVSRISCSDGSCSVEAVVEIEGVEYNAIITGKFTKLPK